MSLKLLEPFKLGTVELKNRIVLVPMVRNCGRNGYVTEQSKAHYEEIARGGAGLLIIEATTVDTKTSMAWEGQLAVDDDKYLPDLKGLVQAIHRHGAKAFLQLQHSGVHTRRDLISGEALSSSPKPAPDGVQPVVRSKAPPKEMTLEDIKYIEAKFAEAAGRARKAGFDGLEISAGHGYLFDQFLSPAWNQRQDGYGGALRNRARLLLETIEAMRKEVGGNYPVVVRFNAEESGVPGGSTLSDARELALMLEKSGVDALSVSAAPAIRNYYAPPAYFEHFSGEIKKLVRVPVINAGGIDAEIGERMLGENKADLIGLGRPLLADTELPNKLASGRADEIRPCIMCLYCQDCIFYKNIPLGCSVNAAVGREKEYAIAPAKKAKKVVVIGGGPAGMEAARVAALKGHEVALYEREPVLGGLLNLAALPPKKDRMEKLRDYLVKQMGKRGVKVELGKEVTPALFKELEPDVVIVATGSISVLPRIPGVERESVVSFADVLTGKAGVGERVIILGGSGSGCETADLLAKKGKKVTIVEMLDVVLKEVMPSRSRDMLILELTRDKVEILTDTRAEEVTGDGLLVISQDGSRKLLKADSVVLAAGSKPEDKLYQEIRDKFPEVYSVGDCVKCGLVIDAIWPAYETALKI